MRFVDLKIRTKLFGAFGILILIGIFLVAYYVITLLFFKKDINAFSKEFLPQLELSTKLSNETQMIAFNMEGYYLTGKPENFKLARVELDSLKNTLSQGEQLLENSKNLSKLELNLSEARILIPQYEQTIMMAFKTVQDINVLKIKLVKNSEIARSSVDQKKKTKKNVKNTADKAITDNNSSLVVQLAEKEGKLKELQLTDAIISKN